MREIRLYSAELGDNTAELVLQDDTHYQLSRVLRLKPGQALTLFNGKGLKAESEIIEINKQNTRVKIKQTARFDNRSPLSLTLIQALTRNEKMDWIIQKATELGVDHIMPVVTEYCQIKLNEDKKAKRASHWEKIIIAACAQSERSHLPRLSPVTSLADGLSQNNKPLLVLHARSEKNTALPKTLDKASVLIGPEGGLSDSDLSHCDQCHARFLTLGPRILRTETAGLAFISVLQSRFGDFGL